MLSTVEVLRRFPEVMKIEDEEIRTETIEAIRQFPTYFWDVPASSSGKYHNPWCRNKHGLWIHVKMAFTAMNRYVDSYVNQGLITEYGADCARSAILLHDMLKQGDPEERLLKKRENRHTVRNHDLVGAEWLAENTDLPQEVIDAVETHNGPWYDGRAPSEVADPRSITFHVCQLVHMSDMAASSPDGTWGLYEPPREITDRYPNIPRANLQ